MVDALAVTAVAVLSPYLAKTGDEFAKQAGGALYDKIGAVVAAIKEKFTGDRFAEETLARVEQKPYSQGATALLTELLSEKIEADPVFGQILRRLIDDTKSTDTRNVLAIGERSVALGGDNTGTITTGDQLR